MNRQAPSCSTVQPHSFRGSLWLVLWLELLLALLYLPGLDFLPFDKEEPRRSLIARNMLDTGDYLVPTLLGQPYTAKPPLFNWLIAATSLPNNKEITEFTARLPSVLALALLTAVMVLGMRRFISIRGQTFLGIALLLTPELMRKATLAEIELTFTLLVTLSIWTWYWRYHQQKSGLRLWLMPLLFTALSFLTKGPPALLFFYLSIVPFLVLRKNYRELFGLGHATGLVVMILIIGCWIFFMLDRVGVATLHQTIEREMLARGTLRSTYEVLQHILIYPLELSIAMLPFSLMLGLLVLRTVREALIQRFGSLYTFPLLAILANLPIYLFGDAAVRYFLPMFPTALVITALLFEIYGERSKTSSRPLRRPIDCGLQFFSTLLVGLCIGLVAGAAVTLWDDDAPQVLPLSLTLFLIGIMPFAAVGIYRYAKKDGPRALVPTLVGLLIVTRLIDFTIILPQRAKDWIHTRHVPSTLTTVEKEVEHAQSIHVVGWIPYELYFYARRGFLVPTASIQALRPSDYLLRYERGETVDRAPVQGATELHRVNFDGGQLILYQVGG
jgi:4-amino-4-deoxy-L-arabinose transferase-like glycosyltransferase